MDTLDLSRWQFAITTVYHYLFVPLSVGLAYLIAVLQTIYVIKGDEKYKQLTKFWGTMFLLNFAVGVVTGIIQEFQFGMNWADYSRFVGAVFGGPLAVEALVSFFLESTFLGIWIFGWDRLPKKIHLLCIWLVAIAATLSALWILSANSFMQNPVGYEIVNGRAEMTDFFALLGNEKLWNAFPHVIYGALATGAFFMVGISAYKILRKQQVEFFKSSFTLGIIVALISSVLTATAGHSQAQYLVEKQPMKMAAAEALWETSPENAPLSIFAVIDTENKENKFNIEIPYLLSVMSYNKLSGSLTGMNELQQQSVEQYGEGDYIPPVKTTYWSFRIMVYAGVLMIVLALVGTLLMVKNKLESNKWRFFLKWLLPAVFLPYIANSAGWIMAEVGRQPWIVNGLQKTEAGVSPLVTPGTVLTSLIGFTVVYGILMAVFIYLVLNTTKKGVQDDSHEIHAKPKDKDIEFSAI